MKVQQPFGWANPSLGSIVFFSNFPATEFREKNISNIQICGHRLDGFWASNTQIHGHQLSGAG